MQAVFPWGPCGISHTDVCGSSRSPTVKTLRSHLQADFVNARGVGWMDWRVQLSCVRTHEQRPRH